MRKMLLAMVVLTLTGCSDNPAIRLRYLAEKQYDEAERALKQKQSLSSNLEPQDFEQLTPVYQNLVKFCDAALDSVDREKNPVEFNELNYLCYQAANRLAQLYYSLGHYDSSTVIYERVIKTLNLTETNLVASYVNLGQTLQASGKWDSALTVYNYSVERFNPPVDRGGEVIFSVFNLPLHIYQVFALLQDAEGRVREEKRAEEYYRQFIGKYPGSKLAIASHGNLARLYEETEKWEFELAELDSLATPSHGSYHSVLLRQADILGARLKKYDTALVIYNYLIEHTDAKDSSMIPGYRFKIALVKMEQKKFTEARSILTNLKEDYPAFYGSTPLVQYTLARSWELENRWNVAESEYGLLIEKYRGSTEAMMALLYLVDYYRKAGREAEADRWFKRAEEYLAQVAGSYIGTGIEANALLYTADLYRRAGQWEKSARVLTGLFDKYSASDVGHRAVIQAADIYRRELGQPLVADSLLQRLRVALSQLPGGAENKDLLVN